MHMGCELTFLPRSPVVSFALVTVCTRAFLFPIGIQLIPMNHEQRNPMKLFKDFTSKALRYSLSVVLIVLFLALIGQAISIALYSTLAIACISGIIYLTRSKI